MYKIMLARQVIHMKCQVLFCFEKMEKKQNKKKTRKTPNGIMDGLVNNEESESCLPCT